MRAVSSWEGPACGRSRRRDRNPRPPGSRSRWRRPAARSMRKAARQAPLPRRRRLDQPLTSGAAPGRRRRGPAARARGGWRAAPPPSGRGSGAAGARRRRRAARPRRPSRAAPRSASSRTGKRRSRISGSVRRELVMWVWTALAPSARARRAGAAADGLVVLPLGVAEGEVVHRALAVGHDAQRRDRGRRRRAGWSRRCRPPPPPAGAGSASSPPARRSCSGVRQPAFSGMSSSTRSGRHRARRRRRSRPGR